MKKTTPLQPLNHPLFDAYQIRVFIKRDDLNHAIIQGNKWHKLRLNLVQTKLANKTEILTFGGAHSNHILATAAAAKQHGLKCIGYIRGEELEHNHQAWSPTLKQAASLGMELKFLDRQTYRKRNHQAWLHELQRHHPNTFILPEGGSNQWAVDGIQLLADQLMAQCPTFTHLLCAVGSGGTLAGLVKHLPEDKTLLGVACLKQAEYLIPQIEKWIGRSQKNWQLLTEFHGGGFAKTNEEITFKTKEFEQDFNVILDPVYTAKMVSAFYQLLAQNRFAPGSEIILYHSGGLQGRQD